MHMCTDVYACVCMCAVYACMHVRMRACMHVHVCMCICVHMCTYVCGYVHVYPCMCVYVLVCVHVYVCVYIRMCVCHYMKYMCISALSLNVAVLNNYKCVVWNCFPKPDHSYFLSIKSVLLFVANR